MAKITVQKTEITIVTFGERDYISLSDMANAKESESRAADIIKNWLRNRYTLEFLGTWEMVHNPKFKIVEFEHFKSQAGLARKEVYLLAVFATNINVLVEREAILETIWKEVSYLKTRSMDVYITKLKKYLKHDPEIHLVNKHKKGYILIIQKEA